MLRLVGNPWDATAVELHIQEQKLAVLKNSSSLVTAPRHLVLLVQLTIAWHITFPWTLW